MEAIQAAGVKNKRERKKKHEMGVSSDIDTIEY